MLIPTTELAVRLLVFLFVLVGAPLSFVLMFRLIDYAAHEPLVDEFRGKRVGMDTGQLNAYFQRADMDSVTCHICGVANGETYTYCHNCQERLRT